MADRSVGVRNESHESEVSQSSMFCFDIVSPESLGSSSIWSSFFRFTLPISHCVPECHQKEVKSFTAEKVFFFRFHGRLLGETDEGKEFTIAEGTVKVCWFRLEDLRKCISDRI